MNATEADAFVSSLDIGFPIRIEDGSCDTATESFGLCYGGAVNGTQIIRVADWAKVTRQNLAHEVAHVCQAQYLGYPGHEHEHMERWQEWLHLREAWQPCIALVYGPPTAYGCRVHEDMALSYAWIYGADALPPTPGFFQDARQVQECRDFFRRTFMSDIEWVGPAAQTNFAPGRAGNAVSMIVDHWIGAGTLDGAAQHFKTMQSSGHEASAHYIVGTTGRIVQVVADEDTAYHAGDFGVNQRSIGIEHEATPTLPPTDELYAASAWLHHHLAEKYGLGLEVGVTVKRHRDIIPTQCPGTLDVERIVNEAEDDMFTQADRDLLTRVKDILEARETLVWQARVQRGLDIERGKTYDATKPPIDQRIIVK